MQHCDGTNWIAWGPPNSGAGSTGCSNPSGVEGQITYNTTYNVLQYCDGDNWVQVGGNGSAGSGGGSGDITTGLISHWKLDSDTAGVTPDAVGNNDCAFNNSPTTLPSGGIIDGAVDFDAADDDALDCGSDASIDDLGPLSVSLWLNLVDRPFGTVFVAKGRGSSIDGWWVGTDGSNDSGRVLFKAIFDSGDLIVDTSAGYLGENDWYHIVATWDGTPNASGVHVYVNGIEAEYNTQTDGAGTFESAAANNMYIGRNWGNSDARLDGLADDVRIYDRVLSDDDVAALYDTAPFAPPDITTGLAAHWRLDETSGTTAADSSGNSNTGTWNGSTDVQSVPGKDGTGFDFDRSVPKEVAVNDSASLDIGGTDLTIAMWVYPEDLSGNDQALIGKAWQDGVFSSPYFQYAIEIDNSDDDAFDFIFGDTGSGFNLFEMNGASAQLNTWQHVAFTYDGTDLRGYVNGQQRGAWTETASIGTQGQILRIGSDFASGQHFDGYLDDVRIYSRALETQDIKAIYSTCENPVGRSGQIVYNSTSNAMQYCNGSDWIKIGR